MTLVKIGKKGQGSIPESILDDLGVEGEQMLEVETTDVGAIVLCPIGVHPIELYSEERTDGFLEEDVMAAHLKKRTRRRMSAANKKPTTVRR